MPTLPDLNTQQNNVAQPQVLNDQQAVSNSGSVNQTAVNQGTSAPAAQQNPNGYLPGQSVVGMDNLIDAAVIKGLLPQEQAAQIKSVVTSQNKSMIMALIEDGGVSEDDAYRIEAEIHNSQFIDLTQLDIPKEILTKISASQAQQNMAVPFAQGPQGLRVATIEPNDIQKMKYLGAIVGANIEPVYTSPRMINYMIDNKYDNQVGAEVAEALEDVTDSGLATAASKVTDLSSGGLESAPVSKIVNMILEYSIRYEASDIHIEPRENKIGVRFRIFGVLSEKLTLPKKLLNPVVSRIKILSNLKIDEHRVPQDGRIQVKLGDTAVDLRVSVVPAVYGEKVVMRLLKKGGGSMNLEDTGMMGHAFKSFRKSLQQTQGIILVTGPTGSGKTQTLASSLKILNREDVNIMTLEDPVEIRIDGINQVQVNSDVGLTFATGLRSFLRQDPDIIMVGEIRDSETAALAVQAALTGHLVLATLHTNSAAGAIPRLLDMGIEPFLLASTLVVVLAQRLVRSINKDVIEAYYADAEVSDQIHQVLDGIKYNPFELPNNDIGNPEDPKDDKIALYKGVEKAGKPAYKGRIGIFEALEVNEKISKMILQSAATSDIHKAAVDNGMITMLQDGFIKALEGKTTVEEVLRVQSI